MIGWQQKREREWKLSSNIFYSDDEKYFMHKKRGKKEGRKGRRKNNVERIQSVFHAAGGAEIWTLDLWVGGPILT